MARTVGYSYPPSPPLRQKTNNKYCLLTNAFSNVCDWCCVIHLYSVYIIWKHIKWIVVTCSLIQFPNYLALFNTPMHSSRLDQKFRNKERRKEFRFNFSDRIKKKKKRTDNQKNDIYTAECHHNALAVMYSNDWIIIIIMWMLVSRRYLTVCLFMGVRVRKA